MEDVESDEATRNRSGPGEPIRKASTAMDKEDADECQILHIWAP